MPKNKKKLANYTYLIYFKLISILMAER